MEVPLIGDNPAREVCQTVAGAIVETQHWRNVRTA